MSSLYLDSSALVKYYIAETGSDYARELLDNPDNTINISQLTIVEVAAAVEKRRRARDITERHRARTLARFGMDYRQRYQIARISDQIVESAVALTGRHPLRAYDAMQLATALRLDRVLRENRLSPVTFVSADGLLCDAARAEGLEAVNPNDYP